MHATAPQTGFILALARHVALLQHGAPADEQRDALRAVVLASQDVTVELECRDGQLLVSGRLLPLLPESVEPLGRQMRVHRIRRLVVRRGAMAGELADLAAELARPAREESAAMSVGLWNVQIARDEVAEPAPPPDGEARELAARLDAAAGEEAELVLGRMETVLARAADAGRDDTIVELLLAVERACAGREDARRAQLAEAWLQRASSSPIVRQFAEALPAAQDRGPMLAVLRRLGEVGAHALIAHLMAAESIDERRAYFDAIVALRAGAPLLIDALAHPQWFVVRNAAALLGEMKAAGADVAIAPLLGHRHERVRQAAAIALARLGTERAKRALREAIHDAVPEVRLQAAAALADQRQTTPLAAALDHEPDEEVRLGIIAALGRLGTPAAVQRLIRTSSPGGPTVKSVGMRVAALEALTAARGASSLPMLRELTHDSEPAVRDAARRLIAGVAVQ